MLLAVILAAMGNGQNPLARLDPFVGTFEGDHVRLEIAGAKGLYSGTLLVVGKQFAVTVKPTAGGSAAGSFDVQGLTYSFTLTPINGGFKLTSDGTEYTLTRMGPAPTGASGASIVGLWRNASGSARFNADGTGEIDGNAGKYEIHSETLVLKDAQGQQVSMPFSVRGDTLTLGNGPSVTLNRVREEAGPGTVRAELVGKWCWITQTYGQQGARQSSQCFTLQPNGAYSYAGGTDSYNPFGGSTSQSADSGTWTATETALTAHSRSGKTTVYALEKRNHPKNKDPMLVLNGQTFVTYYNKPPW
jgi:hypothetical protein